MDAYVPVMIWVASAIVCYYIAKARNVKSNLARRLTVVLLGPLAIPLVFLFRPETSIGAN